MTGVLSGRVGAAENQLDGVVMRTKVIRTALACALATHAAALLAEAPIPVSPGVAEEVTVEWRCPTFSWAPAAGAEGQELVVYRLSEEPGAETEAVVRRKLPAAAGSWTPAGDTCLERGARYAWSVRGLGPEAPGEWSTPSLFRVAPEPSVAQLERSLEMARRRLAGGPEAVRHSPPPVGTYPAPGEDLVIRADPADRPPAGPPPRSHAEGGISVDGESVMTGLEVVATQLPNGPFMFTGTVCVFIEENLNACPTGKMAIGGGFETSGLRAFVSKPGPTGVGWVLTLCHVSDGTLTTEIEYWVVCAHP